MALTADRNTPRKVGEFRDLPVSASTQCYQGGIAVMNGTTVEPGTTAVGLVPVGRFEENVDNSAGAAGDETARVRAGVFAFNNSAAGDEITRDHIGQDCHIVDDETVALTDGTGSRSVAGKIWDVDAEGVWVKVGL